MTLPLHHSVLDFIDQACRKQAGFYADFGIFQPPTAEEWGHDKWVTATETEALSRQKQFKKPDPFRAVAAAVVLASCAMFVDSFVLKTGVAHVWLKQTLGDIIGPGIELAAPIIALVGGHALFFAEDPLRQAVRNAVGDALAASLREHKESAVRLAEYGESLANTIR